MWGKKFIRFLHSLKNYRLIIDVCRANTSWLDRPNFPRLRLVMETVWQSRPQNKNIHTKIKLRVRGNKKILPPFVSLIRKVSVVAIFFWFFSHQLWGMRYATAISLYYQTKSLSITKHQKRIWSILLSVCTCYIFPTQLADRIPLSMSCIVLPQRITII